MGKVMVSKVLQTAGFVICFICTVYMLYFTVCWRTAEALEVSGKRSVTIAGVAAVTEGEVVRAGSGHTVIRYYHEWDGTDYQRVFARENADYPLNARVPVVYTVGMGAGSCLAAGFYRKPMQALSVVGAVLLLVGITLSLLKKGKGRNGKKKDHSRQLEDEYDTQ